MPILKFVVVFTALDGKLNMVNIFDYAHGIYSLRLYLVALGEYKFDGRLAENEISFLSFSFKFFFPYLDKRWIGKKKREKKLNARRQMPKSEPKNSKKGWSVSNKRMRNTNEVKTKFKSPLFFFDSFKSKCVHSTCISLLLIKFTSTRLFFCLSQNLIVFRSCQQ